MWNKSHKGKKKEIWLLVEEMREDILFIVHPGYNLSAHTSYLSQWEKERDENIKE